MRRLRIAILALSAAWTALWAMGCGDDETRPTLDAAIDGGGADGALDGGPQSNEFSDYVKGLIAATSETASPDDVLAREPFTDREDPTAFDTLF